MKLQMLRRSQGAGPRHLAPNLVAMVKHLGRRRIIAALVF